MNPDTDLQVLFASFSSRRKPFHAASVNPSRYLIRYQTEGQCEMSLDKTQHQLGPGDLVVCPPGVSWEIKLDFAEQPHKASADYFMHASGGWLDGSPYYQAPLVARIGVQDDILKLWRLLIAETRKDKDPAIVAHLTKALLLKLTRLIDRDCSERQGESSYVPFKIKSYIEKHAPYKITLEKVARSVNLSVSRASQLFKSAFNQSIMDYVIEFRIAMACERIVHSHDTLEDISKMCGFKNYTHFYRVFCARTGVSPRTYKKNKV